MMNNYPQVSIIILNYNGWQDTIECLESVYQINYPNYYVILIDNGSLNNSVEKIKEYCEGKIIVESKFFKYDQSNKPIKIFEFKREEIEDNKVEKLDLDSLLPNRRLIIIKNEKNYGFAEGNNIGIEFAFRHLKPEYILFLNNDTVVERNFLEELVKAIKDNDKTGSVQPILLRYDGLTIDSLGQSLVRKRLKIFDEGYDKRIYDYEIKNIKKEIFGTCCAAALYKVSVLKKIGYFDNDFFCIYEDVDLSFRIRLSEYKAYLIPSSVVYHKRGISGRKDKFLSIKNYLTLRNYIAILIRYYHIYLLIENFYKIIYILLKWFINAIYFRKINESLSLWIKSLKYRRSIDRNMLININKSWIK